VTDKAHPLAADDILRAIELAGVGHAVTDRAGCLIRCSPAFRAQTGLDSSCDERPWFECDHAPEPVKADRRARWQAFVSGGAEWRGVVPWHGEDGELTYFDGTAIMAADDTVVLVTNDRTERMRSFKALRAAKRQTQKILTALPVSVSLHDEADRILFINPYLPARLGFDPQELIGSDTHEALGRLLDDDSDEALTEMTESQDRVRSRLIDVTEGPLTGTSWLVLKRPLEDGQPTAARTLCIAVDRTDSARLQRERAQFAAAVQETQRIEAINDFAGNLAHELSNLLHPAGVYARLLAKDSDLEDRAAIAARINESIMSAGRLLRRTLGLARIEREPLEPTDLAPMIRETISSAQDLAPRQLTYRIAGEGAAIGCAAVGELRQVLLNLLNNAAEAMHYEGEVLVDWRTMETGPDGLSFQPTGEPPFLKICVCDRGPGIEPAAAARIFEPFYTTKEAGRGTGLGLAVVQGLVVGWGGAVTISQREGGGTAFEVWIPARSVRK
jgi:signal transduction histidine kinase